MKKKTIYKIAGVALLCLYIIFVYIFANSTSIKNNQSSETFLPLVLGVCLIGGVVFLILGFKKNKNDKKFEMTEEKAQNIIKKTDNIKKIALILIGIGAILLLIGYFSIENIGKIGWIFWIIGVFVGMFAKEGKQYKLAKNYVKEGNVKYALRVSQNDGFDNLMTSQFPALYISTNDNTYKKKYFDIMLKIGFSKNEIKNLFEFECNIITKFNKQYLSNPQFTQLWFFGLSQPFFQQYPKTKEDILKESFFTISEICKMLDEAEWHFWNSHEKNISNEVFAEIYEWRLKGNGMDFALKYFDMIREKTCISSENMNKLVNLQGEHLAKYKW